VKADINIVLSLTNHVNYHQKISPEEKRRVGALLAETILQLEEIKDNIPYDRRRGYEEANNAVSESI
jgi:hypothetical protein